MCGRYSLTTPVEGLRQLFEFPEQPNLMPRYNIAPTQQVAAVRSARPAGATEKSADPGDAGVGDAEPGDAGVGDAGVSSAGRHLVLLRWGLIPSWAKDSAIGARMINARVETLAEKPAFRTAFKKRRCLILADGFYEWQKRGTGPKQPYRVARRDGAPFAFAGLWERWRDPADGHSLETCTIVTTDADALLRPIHHRMPVILAPEGYEPWLDPDSKADRLQTLLAAEPGLDLVAVAISTRVNKVANDDPEVLQPLEGTSGGPGGPGDPGDDAAGPAQAKLL